MIVENAFGKLLENLLMDSFRKDQCEGYLVGQLAIAVLQELSIRNFDNPARYIKLERPYECVPQASHSLRADLYVEYPFLGQMTSAQADAYGIGRDNWLEAKFFTRSAGTAGAARVAFDLLRLCTFVLDSGDGTRYLLLVFNALPEQCVQIPMRGKTRREWLESLLKPGVHEIELDFDKEPESFKFRGDGVVLKATIYVSAFEPAKKKEMPGLYWGYLITVRAFSIDVGALNIQHHPDHPVDQYDASRETHAEISALLANKLRSVVP